MYYHSYLLILSSLKLKPTPAQCLLKNYLQHSKKSYFSAIQGWMRLTLRCPKWHGENLITCAKKYKKLLRSWKENTVITISASLMVRIRISSITSNIFYETQVKILGLVFERKHDLIHQNKWTKHMNLFFICPNKE